MMNQPDPRLPGDAEFSYSSTKQGTVLLHWRGKLVKALRGRAAEKFLERVKQLDAADAQRLMAVVTGQFRRGTER